MARSPAAKFALRATHAREIESARRRCAVSLAAYHRLWKPGRNDAGRCSTKSLYDTSRMISEPTSAMTAARRATPRRSSGLRRTARDLVVPAYVLPPDSGEHRRGLVAKTSSRLSRAGTIAGRLYTTLRPRSQTSIRSDLRQLHGWRRHALVEFGVCSYEDVNDVIVFENLIAPTGRYPLNTSGNYGGLRLCMGHLEAGSRSAHLAQPAAGCTNLLVAGGP